MGLNDWLGSIGIGVDLKMMGRTKTSIRESALCSFCRKSYRDVGPLVEGPGDAYICGECVELCTAILEQEKRRRGYRATRLGDVAHGRSGDKGNHANIGIACRDEAMYRFLINYLTADRVAAHFRALGFAPSSVARYELPNLFAFNFVLYDVLDGGASRSLRMDSQGKTLALQLLDMEILVPEEKWT
jgi:hypothetical protein